MRLKEIMTTRVVTVEMDDTLSVIQEIFEKAGFHHLLVLSDRQVIGIISDRDLLKELSPYLDTTSEQKRDLDTLAKRAHQVMSRKLVSATPHTTVKEAARLLVQHSISCLPIIDTDKRPLGIVTWKDILRRCI